MMEMIRDVYRAAVHVVDEGTEEDESFIVTFNKKIELGADFISDKHRLQNSILGLRADGETALCDAIDFALDHLKQARHRKKVLVVITDGEDNSSRNKFRELIERAEKANALIYQVWSLKERMSIRTAKWRPAARIARMSSTAYSASPSGSCQRKSGPRLMKSSPSTAPSVTRPSGSGVPKSA